MAPRPWLLVAGTAVVATAATIAVVNLAGGNDSPATAPAGGGTTPAAASPSPTPSVTATATPSPSPSTVGVDGPGPAVPVYYIGTTARGPRLYREFHPGTGPDRLQQAVSDAVGRAADDPDYHSGWPAGTTVTAGTDAGTITLDLTGASLATRPAGMSQDEAKAALQQLVYTAQAATQTTDPVQLTLGGKVTDTVLGEPTLGATERGRAADVLAQVWVTAPGNGATVSSGFRVTGLAAAFEATVQWELKQGTAVVRKGFTTAQQCCVMAPYSFTVTAPAGHYTLVVHDSDASGNGAPLWQDTKELTVR